MYNLFPSAAAAAKKMMLRIAIRSDIKQGIAPDTSGFFL